MSSRVPVYAGRRRQASKSCNLGKSQLRTANHWRNLPMIRYSYSKSAQIVGWIQSPHDAVRPERPSLKICFRFVAMADDGPSRSLSEILGRDLPIRFSASFPPICATGDVMQHKEYDKRVSVNPVSSTTHTQALHGICLIRSSRVHSRSFCGTYGVRPKLLGAAGLCKPPFARHDTTSP